MSKFDPTGTDALTGGRGAITHPTSGLNRRDNNNFNPRVGLAWHPLEKWVFRGGFGFYTVDVKFPAGRDNVRRVSRHRAAAGDSRRSDADLPDQPGHGSTGRAHRRTASRRSSGPTTAAATSAIGIPNLRNPYVMNWNASVQYEFMRDYLIEVSYQGSGGVGLVERWELNTIPIRLRRQHRSCFARIWRPLRTTARIRTWAISPCAPTSATRPSTRAPSSWRSACPRACSSTRSTRSRRRINSADTRQLRRRSRCRSRIVASKKARAGYDRNHRYIGDRQLGAALRTGQAVHLRQPGWQRG